MKTIKKVCFSIGIISLSWWIGVKLLLLSQVAFNFSLPHIDDVREVPVGAISCTVIIIAAVIKIYHLGKEAFYIWIAASFLGTALYVFGAEVLNIDLTKKNSISIAEIIVLCAISVFSSLVVFGFWKLWKKIKENPIDKDYWVDLLS